MEPIEIFLVVVGVILVTVTYILSEKFEMGSTDIEDELGKNAKRITEELVKKEVNIEMANIIDEKVETASVELDKIVNEKIMAVGSFSEEILEKISNNHNEVMFLYNMLSEKEKVLKDTIRDIEALKLSIKKMAVVNELASNTVAESSKKEKSIDLGKQKEEKVIVQEPKSEANNSSEERIFENAINNNEEILKMYRSGKSNIEIAKALGLGLGEVRLVIDLFKKES